MNAQRHRSAAPLVSDISTRRKFTRWSGAILLSCLSAGALAASPTLEQLYVAELGKEDSLLPLARRMGQGQGMTDEQFAASIASQRAQALVAFRERLAQAAAQGRPAGKPVCNPMMKLAKDWEVYTCTSALSARPQIYALREGRWYFGNGQDLTEQMIGIAAAIDEVGLVVPLPGAKIYGRGR